MSRHRRRAILRRIEKIARRDKKPQSTIQLLRDIADLHAMRAEVTALLIERMPKKPDWPQPKPGCTDG